MAQSDISTIIPIVLCGGSGTRLWPLSRTQLPKQFLRLTDHKLSLLQKTLLRVQSSEFTAPVIIASDAHRFLISEQLNDCDIDDYHLILEPHIKNTAPAIALGITFALKKDPDALVLILPSDHLIHDEISFLQTVKFAANAAQLNSAISTFGIQPTAPHTGYGYIKAGPYLNAAQTYRKLDKFVEKPDRDTANSYLQSGEYYWNSGMFLGPAHILMQELEKFESGIATQCKEAIAKAEVTSHFVKPNTDAFEKCKSISIDYAIMERTTCGVVVPSDFGWSDVGDWPSLWAESEKDQDGNVLTGDVLVDNVENCFIRSDGPLIAGVGLRNLAIVATSDAVLVTDQSQAQGVKNIVEQLQQTKRQKHIHHVEIYQPWGSYISTDHGDGFETRRMTVKPQASLSIHNQPDQNTQLIVVDGEAVITFGQEKICRTTGQATHIPAAATYQVENTTDFVLQLITVKTKVISNT